MKQNTTSEQQILPIESTFKERFKGKFYGVLQWKQLDHIWDVVKSDKADSWFIYEVNLTPPSSTIKQLDIALEINKIDHYLRKEHNEDYCGIVYADDLESPEFIKVFNPKSLGSSCSIAKTPPLPKWIISKVKPQDLTLAKEQTNKPKRWLGNLFSK